MVVFIVLGVLICLNVLKKSIKKSKSRYTHNVVVTKHTVEHCFPIDEIDNIYALKATSICTTQNSINMHSTEMINQNEIRMTSFDGYLTVIEVSMFIMVYNYIKRVCFCLRDHRRIQ